MPNNPFVAPLGASQGGIGGIPAAAPAPPGGGQAQQPQRRPAIPGGFPGGAGAPFGQPGGPFGQTGGPGLTMPNPQQFAARTAGPATEIDRVRQLVLAALAGGGQ